MKQFTYKIVDPLGIHARPAGLLAKFAREFQDTEVTIRKKEAEVKATQLMRLMRLGVRQGDEITVTAQGASEEQAIEAMKRFFTENL